MCALVHFNYKPEDIPENERATTTCAICETELLCYKSFVEGMPLSGCSIPWCGCQPTEDNQWYSWFQAHQGSCSHD